MMESDATTSRTSAHALHDLIRDVRNSQSLTLATAWSEVLNVQWNTSEFSQRHCEVVGLLSDVISQLDALPERTQERIFPYTHSWWRALVRPDTQWQANNAKPITIISKSDLDQLDSLADILSSNLNGTAAAPEGTTLAELRHECEEWLPIIDDTQEIVDESFRYSLKQQINHLIWLIDNASTFGVARVVQYGDQLTGAFVRCQLIQERQETKRTSKIWKKLAAFVTALALVSKLAHDSETVVRVLDHSATAIEGFLNN